MTNIFDKINKFHGNDKKQLEVIFSKKQRIIVEAPAGYGKTATMVSRIAYLYSVGLIPNPKKILALTFSVNAALKIKRDVAEKLPILIQEKNNPINIGEKVTVTNYHGFCKTILDKYGYNLSPLLKRDINSLCVIGDESVERYDDLKSMNNSDKDYMKYIDAKIKGSVFPDKIEILKYNKIVIDALLPKDIITHTAILLMTIELLDKNRAIELFYQNYYPLLIVDEFQDTNCVAWELLKRIICEKTQILFLGDSLQRIYGFIGAVPEIMEIARIDLNAEKIILEKNYRFKDNYEMLKLDRNIRLNATYDFEPNISENASLETFWAANQTEEAQKVISKIVDLQEAEKNDKVAILFRSRGDNSEIFEKELINSNIDYFYGMFTDDDQEYIDFHRYCQNEFIKKFEKNASIGKKSLTDFSRMVAENYNGTNVKMTESLCVLLDAFIKRMIYDYSDLSGEDKYLLALDVFENKQLKQAMEYVDAQLILSTIHGAKGLEWSYVFLADLERWGLPSYFTCKNCVNKFTLPIKSACPMPSVDTMNMEAMLDELSVLYVAVTRARKQVYVSASAKRVTGKEGCLSCMSHLPGIVIVNAEKECLEKG